MALSLTQRLFQDERVLAAYERFRESPLFWPIVGRTLAQETEEALWSIDACADTEGPVLDVACGQGTFTVALARARPERRVTGLDLSDRQLRRARRKASDAGVANVEFVLSDATAMPFPDASFSAVVTFTGMHQIPDHAPLVAEIARVSRPGATFHGATFGARRLPGPLRRRPWPLFGIRPVDAEDLGDLLERAGFEGFRYRQHTPIWGVFRARRGA